MKTIPKYPRWILIFFVLTLIPTSACNYPEGTAPPTDTQVTATANPPKNTPGLPPLATPTHHTILPSATRTLLTTDLPAPLQSPRPSFTSAVQTVNIFLIAIGDNGISGKRVGCGDSLIPVQQSIASTQGVLRAALEALLGLDEQVYGESGLYNSLYASDLQLQDVRISNGTAIIELSGLLMLGGVCDNPRLEAQLIETALQFSTVQRAEIFVNGQPLEEAISLK